MNVSAVGLFVCDVCGCVDHTDLAQPLVRWQCSACNKQIGQWHGCFERQPYDPINDDVINRSSKRGLG